MNLMLITRRRFLPTVVASSLIPLLQGCAHEPATRVRRYTELVSTLLLSRDGAQLVVLGANYHYVFDAPADLVRLSRSPLKASVTAMIEPFRVQPDGVVNGAYTLVLSSDANLAGRDSEIQALGFRPTESGRWVLPGQLRGKRYFAGNTLRAGRIKEVLPQTYEVTVEAEEYPDQRLADDLATPIVLASNGVLLLYYVVLAPVVIPVMFFSQEKQQPLGQFFR